MIGIYVIMYSLKLFDSMELALFKNDLRNDPAVQLCVFLHDLHVVDIIVKRLSFAPGHFVRDRYNGLSLFLLPLREKPAEFFLSLFSLYLCDERGPLFSKDFLVFSSGNVALFISKILVILRDVLPASS